MTVIAWDGFDIAADKAATYGESQHKVTKIFRMPDGKVVGYTGMESSGSALIAWLKSGANPENFPAIQKTENWSRLIVANWDGCVYYEIEPYPIEVEDDFFAWGSGKDFALGAMSAGKTAKDAVLITNGLCTSCGIGVDVFNLRARPDRASQNTSTRPF